MFCLTACPSMATITGSMGVITSPFYPGHYDNNQNCSWKIIASRGERIYLFILDIDIERGTNCPHDYIEIQNGYFALTGVIGRLCGTSQNSTIVSYQQNLIVRFVTDGSVTRKGFRLGYLVIGGHTRK